MAKIKNKVKKVFRLPSNAVVMSMMAVILVCAAPALVSAIDDTLSYEHTFEADLDPDLYTVHARKTGETPLPLSYVVDPVDPSIITIAFPEGSDPTMYLYVLITNETKIFDGQVRNLRFTVTGDPTKVYINSIGGLNKLSDGVFLTDVSTIDNERLSDSSFEFQVHGCDEVFTVDIDIEKSASFAYGDFIIGATGVLLLTCAILATPWFGTSGLTIKRRR
jgi:hypothetical protein